MLFTVFEKFRPKKKIITTRKMKHFIKGSFLFDQYQFNWDNILESTRDMNEAVINSTLMTQILS